MENKNAIGIDIGGTNLRVALVSEDGNILDRIQHPSTDDIEAKVVDSVDQFRDTNTKGIGIAVAGIIDREKGKISFSPNLPLVESLDLVTTLRGKHSLPVFIDNDANAATLGEKYIGKGRHLNSFILLTLGTGVGGGIVYNSELMNVPAEIGHMTIVQDGIQCVCGNHGCLEEYAAAKAMINMATSALEGGETSSLGVCCEGNIYKITPKLISEHAMDGDRLAKEILRTAGKFLGIGIANLTNIFHPQAIILAGGLTNARDLYIEEAIKEADKRAMAGLFSKSMVLISDIRENAGLIGAALHSLKFQ
ncbi:MAG: ROK family protein [Thermodesulfovibrionales bacterium]